MSVKQRAYPEQGSQLDTLLMHVSHARFVYNLGLEQRKMLDRSARERGIKLSSAVQMRQLTEARAEFDWLRNGSTVVQQGALRDLDRAFTNFFAKRARFPRFKRRGVRESFTIRDVSLRRYNRKWAAVQVPKAGWLRFRLSRRWSDLTSASSARVSFHNELWHISFTTPPPQRGACGTGVVGLDRGVAVTVATSDSGAFQAPSLTEGEQQRFLSLERLLATQSKGSHRREVTKRKLSVLRNRLGDRRSDWVEQTTTILARTYEAAVVEKLNISAMTRRPAPKPDDQGGFLPNGAAAKSGLNRSIHASLWGRFESRLRDKMGVLSVPAAYTSQRCSECGHIDPESRESQAVFQCVQCGHRDNADVNAAKNIRFLALEGSGIRLSPGAQGDRANRKRDANLQTAS